MAQENKILRYIDILFYVLFLATIVVYFAFRSSHPKAFISVGIAAIAVRVVSYVIRFTGRSK